MSKRVIQIPNAWAPRDYQRKAWVIMEQGGKRLVLVWHRRAGKDSFSLNWTAVSALGRRKGVYWHMLPTAKQGRKVVWDGIDRQGRRIIDQAFPPEIRKSTNQQEMRIELKNGSIWQVVGSDNYDSLVGANPVGVVFSEYSVADPMAWRYLSPILAENGGWAIFIYTPRGKNHGYKLFRMAQKHPNWYTELLSLDKSKAYPLEIIEEERAMGMPDEIVDQEYFCSFEAAIAGSIYGSYISKAYDEGRIGAVPYLPNLPVYTSWDLGLNDDMVIWFYQLPRGGSIRFFDLYYNRGPGLDHYVHVLRERGYVYGEHWLPHDIKVRELGNSGKTRLRTLHELGMRNMRVAPKLGTQEGINAVRMMLPKCYFDETKCEMGIDGLMDYHSEFSEKLETHKNTPTHNWASHYADAIRTCAVGSRTIFKDRFLVDKPPVAIVNYDPFNPLSAANIRRQELEATSYDPFNHH